MTAPATKVEEVPAGTATPVTEMKGLTRIDHPFEREIRETPAMPSEREFEGLMKMADTLAKSGFLPSKLNTAGKVLAVILTGRELGLPPMMSTRSIRLVDGNPVVAADVLLGAFKRSGGKSKFIALDEKRAAIYLVHPNGDDHTETFTIQDADKAKLLGKDNWKHYPKAMLRSRVITAGLKSLGWEPAAGVYDPDEAEEISAARGIGSTVTARVSQEGTVETADIEPAPAVTIRGKLLDQKTADDQYALSLSALLGSLKWGGEQLNETNVDAEMRKYERFIAAVQAEIERRYQEDMARAAGDELAEGAVVEKFKEVKFERIESLKDDMKP